jgi:hypothetical protein
MKIRAVGAELLNADGQTDRQTHMKKLIVAFRNFAKASKHLEQVVKINLYYLRGMFL